MRVRAEHPKHRDAVHRTAAENQLRGLEIISFGGGLLSCHYTELGLPPATHRFHLCDKTNHPHLWALAARYRSERVLSVAIMPIRMDCVSREKEPGEAPYRVVDRRVRISDATGNPSCLACSR